MFAPTPPGLAAMWDHWADLERDERDREEAEEQEYLASLDELIEAEGVEDD